MRCAKIEIVTTHCPEQVLGNEELASRWESWTAEKIEEKTGIRERRIAAPDECSSDLAVAAAEKLFYCLPEAREKVDYLLFCTQTPDYILPTSACLIQHRLKLSCAVGALDFNQGCSGYVVGLSLAKGLIESGQAESVLLLTGETYSKLADPNDSAVTTLFGDGGTATLIQASEDEGGLGEFVFGTDGKGGKNLMVEAGGYRLPCSESTAQKVEQEDGSARAKDYLYMNGPEIFRFAISEVPRSFKELLKKAELEKTDIDYLVLHQANKFMLDHVVKRLRMPPEKCPYEFGDIGNTVSCTIPFVLSRLDEKAQLTRGQQLVLVGFGVGYSWAGCELIW